MGVGRMYADYPYHPPPTAPDNNRLGAPATGSNFTHGLSSRASARHGQTGQTTNQNVLSNGQDRRELKSAQTVHMVQMNNARNLLRQKTSVDVDHSNKHCSDIGHRTEVEHEKHSSQFEYSHGHGNSIEHLSHANKLEHMKHDHDWEHLKHRHELEEAKLREDLLHPKHRSKISETHYSQNPGMVKVEYNEDFYTKGQGYLSKLHEEQNLDQEYVAFQNVKHHIIHREEYNNSSSTPTVPYSTADILYGSEVNGRERQASVNDEPRQNSFGDSDRTKEKQKGNDLEAPSNRRPSSKTGKQRSISIDTVTPFDKDRDREDPIKGLSAALPPAKPAHHFRPNGIRSSSKAEQLFSSKQNGALSGRDQDDLVAMGTLWSPNNVNSQQPLPPNPGGMTTQSQTISYKNGSVPNSNTNSYPSKVISSASSMNNSVSNNTLNSQRKYSNSMRPLFLQNNVSGKKTNSSPSQSKEQEDPKYSDPMMGAPASFQQRIIELGALEGDTVRWERSKRLKKKKQDRDS